MVAIYREADLLQTLIAIHTSNYDLQKNVVTCLFDVDTAVLQRRAVSRLEHAQCLTGTLIVFQAGIIWQSLSHVGEHTDATGQSVTAA